MPTADWEKTMKKLDELLQGLYETGSGTLQRMAVNAEKEVARQGLMGEIVRRRFEYGKDRAYGGSKWKSRKDSNGWPILRKTGRLMGQAQAAVRDAFVLFGETVFEDATERMTLPYAEIHQYGGTTGHGAFIPARPYLNDPDERELEKARKVASDMFARQLARALRIKV